MFHLFFSICPNLQVVKFLRTFDGFVQRSAPNVESAINGVVIVTLRRVVAIVGEIVVIVALSGLFDGAI